MLPSEVSLPILRRDRQVSGLLEESPKLRLWSEAHGSICVQEGEPNLRRPLAMNKLTDTRTTGSGK
jgi:hypothetical protein